MMLLGPSSALRFAAGGRADAATASAGARGAKSAKGLSPTQLRLKNAAEDFEGLMIEQMLTEMRSSHLAKDPLDSGNESDIMHSMLDAQMGKEIAHGHSLGLADTIFREFQQATH